MIHKVEYESKIKCPADKFFFIFRRDYLDLPNAMPESYKSVKVLKGDGKSVGSIILWTFVQGDDPNKVYTVKEQFEKLDDENRRITMRILEGEVMDDFKSLVLKLSVTPTTNGGSLVKWVVEFEKKLDHSHVDVLAMLGNHFDALLHKVAAVE